MSALLCLGTLNQSLMEAAPFPGIGTSKGHNLHLRAPMGSGEALGQDFYGVHILTLIPSLLPPALAPSQHGLSNSTQILRATSGEPILRQWEQRHADGWTCKQEGG